MALHVAFMGHRGGAPCGVHSVSRVYEVFDLLAFCGIQRVRSVYGALGLDLCGVYRVSSVYGALGWTFGAFSYSIWGIYGALAL